MYQFTRTRVSSLNFTREIFLAACAYRVTGGGYWGKQTQFARISKLCQNSGKVSHLPALSYLWHLLVSVSWIHLFAFFVQILHIKMWEICIFFQEKIVCVLWLPFFSFHIKFPTKRNIFFTKNIAGIPWMHLFGFLFIAHKIPIRKGYIF